MKREIKLRDKKIDFTFKKSNRAKTMKLTVHCDGAVTATIPRFLSENAMVELILRKADWIISKIGYFSNKTQLPGGGRTDYLENKRRTLSLVQEKIQRFNKVYNLSFRRISIKNQKSRWGSCSRKKNLNFNYRIVFLPDRFSDYIVVHELCHLKELNHSRNFWQLVSETIPDYRQIRKELKNFLFTK
ncbi:MAG: M48 family metallopeptidase [bacterium]